MTSDPSARESDPTVVGVEMPEPIGHVHSNGDFCWDRHPGMGAWPVSLITLDEARAYGLACRAAAMESKADEIDILQMHVQDLAMTVRLLCHRLKKHEPEASIIKRAMEYQVRHKLTSPLRGAGKGGV